MNDPVRLKDLLGRVGERVGIQDPRATGRIWTSWRDIVGEAIAANAEPTSLREGILRVRAVSPTWAAELTYLGDEIRARANELVGSEVVREVRVWTGPGPVSRATATASERSSDGRLDETPTGPDEDLGSAFQRARAAWARRASKRS